MDRCQQAKRRKLLGIRAGTERADVQLVSMNQSLRSTLAHVCTLVGCRFPRKLSLTRFLLPSLFSTKFQPMQSLESSDCPRNLPVDGVDFSHLQPQKYIFQIETRTDERSQLTRHRDQTQQPPALLCDNAVRSQRKSLLFVISRSRRLCDVIWGAVQLAARGLEKMWSNNMRSWRIEWKGNGVSWIFVCCC